MPTRTSALDFLRRIPALRTVHRYLRAFRHLADPFLQFVPPGHFYSPLPDVTEVRRNRVTLFDRDAKAVPGIATREAEQLRLVEALGTYAADVPFGAEPREGLRYFYDNPFFGRGSAVVLYLLMRHFAPKRIVEVGSGFSSAVMLDANDRHFGGAIRFTFIEPNPERLRSLLRAEDARQEVLPTVVQGVPLDRFADLGPNDFLLIDSSHVVKIGSDVDHLLTHVLPALQPGVLVHFHDVHWPFEYPEAWVMEGRGWNEAYALKAFLQFNAAFELLLFNDYLATHHRDFLRHHLPDVLPDAGSSVWLRKTA